MDKQKNSSSKITFSEKSFSNGFFSILKIILLFAACIFTSIIIVWPFWKFSTALPKAYTIAVLSVISIFLLFLIIKKVIHSKKSSVIKVFVNLALICAGLFFTVRFVLLDKKAIGLLLFLLAIVLLLIFNFLINRITHD